MFSYTIYDIYIKKIMKLHSTLNIPAICINSQNFLQLQIFIFFCLIYFHILLAKYSYQ